MSAIVRTKTWLLWLVVALTGLLLLLAVLQYRWLGQVSVADHERRQAALNIAAQRFSEDFDRELARAFVSFQLDSHTLSRKSWGEFAQRYDRWLTQTPFPRLVRQICSVTHTPAALVCYEPAARRFVEQPFTPALAALHGALEQQRQDLLTGRAAPLTPGFFPLADGFPALINPVMTVEPVPVLTKGHFKFERFNTPFEPGDLFRQYTVVLFDQAYMRETMIPALAGRYFTSTATSTAWDYRLLITDREAPQQVVFTSDPSAPGSAQPADATINLFSLRLELMDNFAVGASGFTAPVLPARGVAFRVEQGGLATFRAERSGAVGGAIAGGAMVRGSLVGGTTVGSAMVSAAPPDRIALFSQEAASWRLSLWHRSGSLEQAVTDVRRRNLFISFGILLLLGGSMALVLMLTMRTRRLAAQQLEFVAGISHELRTPVAVVCMASANLADGMVRGDEQVKQYGAMLQTEGRRLSEMIEQVLDLAGTEAVRKPYQLQPVPVAEPLERALTTLRQHTNDKSVSVECTMAPALPALLADSRALERALYNLLNNAVKYSHEPCQVRVNVRQANAAQLALEVNDHGFGIDPAEVPHLFEPFWRGRAARAANLPGNGLGLCLVDRIVRAHGGKITVTSAPGQGSTFTLLLPCVTAVPSTNAPANLEQKLYEQTSVAD